MHVVAECFMKALAITIGRLRIMQHVMLTSAPYFCSTRRTAGRRRRTERGRERGRERERAFLCLDVKPREALTEMWQIPAKSKTNRLALILICQVRQCVGSVGGVVCLCVLVFPHTYDWRPACIMHVRRHSLCVCVPLCQLSVPSCQLNLSFKHQ